MEDIKFNNRMMTRKFAVQDHYMEKLDTDLCELSGVLGHWLKKDDVDKKEALEYAIRQIDNLIMLQGELYSLSADLEELHNKNIAAQ